MRLPFGWDQKAHSRISSIPVANASRKSTRPYSPGKYSAVVLRSGTTKKGKECKPEPFFLPSWKPLSSTDVISLRHMTLDLFWGSTSTVRRCQPNGSEKILEFSTSESHTQNENTAGLAHPRTQRQSYSHQQEQQVCTAKTEKKIGFMPPRGCREITWKLDIGILSGGVKLWPGRQCLLDRLQLGLSRPQAKRRPHWKNLRLLPTPPQQTLATHHSLNCGG